MSEEVTIYKTVKAHPHLYFFTPELIDKIHENYTNQGRVIVLLVSFLGDRFSFEINGLQKTIDGMQLPKFIENAPIFSLADVSQQLIAPVGEVTSIGFITHLDGANKTDYRSETEFLGNLFYIATEQIIQAINIFGVEPNNTLVQVLFFLPEMANGHLFREKVIGPAQSWLDLNYGNVDIVDVIDINLAKSPLAN